MPSSARVCASMIKRVMALGEAANLAFPRGAVEGLRLEGFTGVLLRRFVGKIGRLIFFFGAEGGVGLDVEVRGGGAFVFAIGEFPEDAGDGVGIIAERQRARGHTAGATLAVRVVEGGRAYAHYDIGLAALNGGVSEQAAVGADEDNDVLVIYGVADEIGSGI